MDVSDDREWSEVNAADVVDAFKQSEHDRRPWKEFLGGISVPPDSSRAISRLKCNLVYYRNNYLQVIAGVTGLYLIRNPIGTISLTIMSVGAGLYMDKVAVNVSKRVMGVLQRVRPKLAERIKSSPGGADGLSGGFGREPVVKIAGMNREKVANALIMAGSVTGIFTGAMKSLTTGLFMGTGVAILHSIMRPPNSSARLHNFKRKLLTM